MSQSSKFLLLILVYLIVSIAIVLVAELDILASMLIIITGLFVATVILAGIQFLSHSNDKRTSALIQESNASYNQIQFLFSIYATLKIDNILPSFRGWAISPDFAALIISKLNEKKPIHVLECGSGVSTLLIAYYLKQKSKGHLYSFEHDKDYAKSTSDLLKNHKLEEYVTIVNTELIEHVINGNEWKWYDEKQLDQNIKYDMVIIDGPPFKIQPKSRYPTLPLLDNYFNPKAVILIDDCAREQDNEVIKDWLKEFNNYESEWFETEKGAYALTKQG